MNLNFLSELLKLDAVSGREEAVRSAIIAEITPYATTEIDASGNLIAFKKGKKTPKYRLMIDAHTDEVGFIVTDISDNGLLRFCTVGSILDSAIVGKRVRIGKTKGVIGLKPVHMCSAEEKAKFPKADELFIDIGAKDKFEAEQYVSLGDTGCFDTPVIFNDDKILSKALDDRIGCAIAVEILKTYDEYDYFVTFTTGEEVGLRGAATAAYTVKPDFAIVVEGTTAADIKGVSDADRVCALGGGAVVSFMDRASVYDRELYDIAMTSGIPAQTKSKVAGGNNAGRIALSGKGVRCLAISSGCRYIHSGMSVASINDIENVYRLTLYMAHKILSGEV